MCLSTSTHSGTGNIGACVQAQGSERPSELGAPKAGILAQWVISSARPTCHACPSSLASAPSSEPLGPGESMGTAFDSLRGPSKGHRFSRGMGAEAGSVVMCLLAEAGSPRIRGTGLN